MVRDLVHRAARWVATRTVPSAKNTTGALYEAGAQTRRTIGWRAPTASANQAILANLTTLRDRSRAATRNDGLAKNAIDKLVSNIIGTGIKPMSLAVDPTFREQVQALWLRWTDEADADGQLDFYGLQRQAVRTWLEGGESFTRLRQRLPGDGLSVPLQLQVIEPELCPHTYSDFSRRIRAGIQFNGIGRRVAYYFHPSRPELDDFDASKLLPLVADNVCHLFDPLRPGQLRGLPHLTQALVALNELSKYSDAKLLRHQLANLFVGFITRPNAVGETTETHPLTGEAPTTFEDAPVLNFEPGIMQELEPGEQMQFSQPPNAEGDGDFVRQIVYEVAAATGVPYEVLLGDMRNVNDRTVRVILVEFRRQIQAMQHQIVAFQWCRRVWKAWLDRVFLSGALPMPLEYVTNPAPWGAVKWVPQGWPYIHPVQDVEANERAVRNGFRSRSSVVSELGEDVEVIDAEQAADNARADKKGLKYDSDGRQPKNAAPASRQPAGDREPDPATQETGAAA